jgi:hypothetical protein
METTLYGEYAKPVNSYSVFLQGDYPLLRIETDLHNGRRIAVVKESFGNAFVPYLVNHYEQILVVDQRYLQWGARLLKVNKTQRALVHNNIFAAYTHRAHQRAAAHHESVYCRASHRGGISSRSRRAAAGTGGGQRRRGGVRSKTAQ